jgi:rare lipoprotein A
MKKYLLLCCLLLALASCQRKQISSAIPGEGKIETEKGIASYYGDEFEGRKTANGEVFNQSKLTAAHKKIAFGTVVKVTNLTNNKFVLVKINDRGPFVSGRIIDLSRAAAKQIDLITVGITQIKLEYRKKN